MINGARTNTGTVGVATLKMASNFKDDETTSLFKKQMKSVLLFMLFDFVDIIKRIKKKA